MKTDAASLRRSIVFFAALGLTGHAGAQVTWAVDANGEWLDPANWSSDPILPGPLDDVVIDRPSRDVSVRLRDAGTEVASIRIAPGDELRQIRSDITTTGINQIDGTLLLDGGSFGQSAGSLIGGTWTGAGQASYRLQDTDVTLRGVTWGLPDLQVVADGTMFIRDGLTLLEGSTLTVASRSARLDVRGEIGGRGQVVIGTTFLQPSGTASFGPDITTVVLGSGRMQANTFVNQGTIRADWIENQTLPGIISDNSFINEGQIVVPNSERMTLIARGGTFVNRGTVSVGESAILEPTGSSDAGQPGLTFRNEGTLALGPNATIDFDQDDILFEGGTIQPTDPGGRGSTARATIGFVKPSFEGDATLRNVTLQQMNVRSRRGSIVRLEDVAIIGTSNTSSRSILIVENERNPSTSVALIATSNTSSARGDTPPPVVLDWVADIRALGDAAEVEGSDPVRYINGRFVQEPADRTMVVGEEVDVFVRNAPLTFGTNEGRIINRGEFRAENMLLEVRGLSFVNEPGGVLEVQDDVSEIRFVSADAAGSQVTNQGTILLGAGLVRSLGDLSLDPSSTVQIDDATAFAPIVVTGAVTLGGTVDVTQPIAGFVNAPLVQSPSVVGMPAVNASVPAGFVLELRQTPEGVNLIVRCPADINADGSVEGGDFFAWVAAFGDLDPIADVNRDGTVDAGDFFAWVAAFGQGC